MQGSIYRITMKGRYLWQVISYDQVPRPIAGERLKGILHDPAENYTMHVQS